MYQLLQLSMIITFFCTLKLTFSIDLTKFKVYRMGMKWKNASRSLCYVIENPIESCFSYPDVWFLAPSQVTSGFSEQCLQSQEDNSNVTKFQLQLNSLLIASNLGLLVWLMTFRLFVFNYGEQDISTSYIFSGSIVHSLKKLRHHPKNKSF